jgi:hypothetical protein
MLKAWGLLVLLLQAPLVMAREAADNPGPKFSFGMGAVLGTETIDNSTYNKFGFLPDFGYGQLGVGLDLTFHFQFYQSPGGPFGVYPRSQDWWDPSLTTRQNIDKYLARLLYVRWGHKGDPLYAQLGLLPDTTLGTGFLVGGYNNGVLRPDFNYVGLEVDASGELIGLPYGGFESFVGNVSAFDVLGGRLYAKPFGLLMPDNAFLKEVQFGYTFAADTNPYAESTGTYTAAAGSVFTTGLDTLVPLYSSELFTAAATGDAALEGAHVGGAVGVGGRAFSFLTWGLQNRFLGDNFIPDYFDQSYEINRVDKFMIYNGTVSVPGTIGWQVSLGTSLLDDAVTAGVTLSGPWTSQASVYAQPELQALAQVKPGLLPVDLSAYYVKKGLTSFGDLGSAENALVGAKLGYTVGVVTVNLVYNLRYLSAAEIASDGGQPPNGNPWVSTSTIETTVKMF